MAQPRHQSWTHSSARAIQISLPPSYLLLAGLGVCRQVLRQSQSVDKSDVGPCRSQHSGPGSSHVRFHLERGFQLAATLQVVVKFKSKPIVSPLRPFGLKCFSQICLVYNLFVNNVLWPVYSSASVTTSSGLVASSFRSPISKIGEVTSALVGTAAFWIDSGSSLKRAPCRLHPGAFKSELARLYVGVWTAWWASSPSGFKVSLLALVFLTLYNSN